jgi:hypothetical protein
MIRHEAIALKAESKLLAFRAQQFEIVMAVVLSEEDVLLVIAPLNDMVACARNDYSSYTWHNWVIYARSIGKIHFGK